MLLNVTLRHQPLFLFRHSSSSSYFSLQALFKLLESFNKSRFSLFFVAKVYLSDSFLHSSISISGWFVRAYKAAISFSTWIALTFFLSYFFCFSPNAFLYMKWICLAFYSNAFDIGILWDGKLFQKLFKNISDCRFAKTCTVTVPCQHSRRNNESKNQFLIYFFLTNDYKTDQLRVNKLRLPEEHHLEHEWHTVLFHKVSYMHILFFQKGTGKQFSYQET